MVGKEECHNNNHDNNHDSNNNMKNNNKIRTRRYRTSTCKDSSAHRARVLPGGRPRSLRASCACSAASRSSARTRGSAHAVTRPRVSARALTRHARTHIHARTLAQTHTDAHSRTLMHTHTRTYTHARTGAPRYNAEAARARPRRTCASARWHWHTPRVAMHNTQPHSARVAVRTQKQNART